MLWTFRWCGGRKREKLWSAPLQTPNLSSAITGCRSNLADEHKALWAAYRGLSPFISAVPARRLTDHHSCVTPPLFPSLLLPSCSAPASRSTRWPLLSGHVIRGGHGDELFVLSANAEAVLSLSFAGHSLHWRCLHSYFLWKNAFFCGKMHVGSALVKTLHNRLLINIQYNWVMIISLLCS